MASPQAEASRTKLEFTPNADGEAPRQSIGADEVDYA